MFSEWLRLETTDCPVCGSKHYTFLRKYENYGFARCNKCRLHYIQPHPVLKDEYQAFDSYDWMTHYTKQFDAEAPLALRSLSEKLRKVKQMSTTTPTSMLDVGCGNGLYLKAAQQLGLKAVGLDVDETHIEFAKSKRLCAYHTKIEELSYTNYFDFVHIKAVLHLVRNPASLLKHTNDLLAENGILYVDASNQEGLFATIRRLFFANPKRFGQILPPLHNMAYTRRSFLTLLEKTGFEPIHLLTFSSGDEIYYPTLKKKVGDLLFRFADFIGKGSLIGAYCQKSPSTPSSDCEFAK